MNKAASTFATYLLASSLLLIAVESRSQELALAECRLESKVARNSVKAQCGWFEVAEDRNAADSKRIRLHVAVIKALRKEAFNDPVVVISGGPGQSASDFYLANTPWFERLRRDRDLLIVDQRGTGHSNRLDCKLPDELETERFDVDTIRKYTGECLRQLAGDPRFYTTSIAVTDLEEVRSALGYETLNIYGISYGTRVAQHYLRRFGNRVRTVVLDGVVPTELALGPDIAPAAQSALDAILDRCAAQSDCHKAYPNVAADLKSLRARLNTAIPLTLRHPTTALITKVNFDAMHLAVALRIHSYSDETAALLPYLIHEAAEDRPAALAAQALLISHDLNEQMANGMHNAVVCTEDVPFITEEQAQNPAIADSYMRSAFLDALQAGCAQWPRGVIDPEFHAPLRSDVPTLLLSGENDPVTPASYGERAARGYSRGKHLIFRGQGHGQLPSICGSSLVHRFIDKASAEGLDESCLTRITPAPFMIDANGPAP